MSPAQRQLPGLVVTTWMKGSDMAKRRGKKPDTPCAECGKLLYTSTTSLPAGQRRCRECRRGTPFVRQCEVCARDFETTRPEARFCSRSCIGRRDGRLSRKGRTCEVCGTNYSANHTEQRACSRPCGEVLRKRNRPPERPIFGPPTPAPRKPTKPGPSVRVFFPFCDFCGASFATRYTIMTCSPRCAAGKKRRDRRQAKDLRRARERGAFVAPVFRRQIFERDRWRCQLCSRPVNRTAVVPHPLAPTLDHIVPLAVGGTHEPANCQLAHYSCNSRKGATGVTADQLRLLG